MNSFNSTKRSQLFAGASIAILAASMIAASAQAQQIETSTNLNSTISAHVTGGDTTPQSNTGAILGENIEFDATTENDGATTNGVFENNANTADATASANRNGVSASLANIGSSGTLLGGDDGIALSAVSENTGATASVTALNTLADIGTTLTDFATGSVDVSNNTASSTAVINDGSNTFAMSITGSEPVGYNNLATANAAVTTDLSGSAANVADLAGTLLVSSVQVADATVDSGAVTFDSTTFVRIDTTEDADVTGTATLDGNDVTATFTANARTASIGLAADDASTSVTAAISNAQIFDANADDSAALVDDNTVRADISGPDGVITTSFVDSSLSVASNTIAAAANGNTATTQIALADGLAYNTVAGNIASATIDEVGEVVDEVEKLADVIASAGLVGVNTQTVANGTLLSRANDSLVEVDVASPESSSIDVSTNRLTSAATGNNLTAGIASGDSSAVFDASAVLASRQQLDSVSVIAQGLNSDILVDVGGDGNAATFADSTITVASNVLASSALGNRARQTIALEATSLNATTDSSAVLLVELTPVEDAGEAAVSADGSVIIASAMINTAASVSANNVSNDIDVSTDDNANGSAENTSVLVTANTQQAFATGSDAGNSLSLTGVNVGSGAGIANLQTNDATSTVSATQTASIDVFYTGNLDSGSSEISGNNASAIARGTVAANTLTVDAQILALGANGAVTDSRPESLDATATAAFGVVNAQRVLADVTATSQPDDTNSFRMDLQGDLDNANTVVNANTLMAQAQGTVATNAVSLDVGTLTSVDSEGDAAIANLQNVSGADILATVNGDDSSPVIETEIDLSVLSSSVETSNNRIMASAESARASNVLTVSGTSLSGNAITARSEAYPDSDRNTVNAQFGVANTQVAGTGTVIASLRETTGDAFADSSAVVTDLNGAVTSSSIESNGNLLQALSSSNRATNAVSVDGTTLNRVTAGLANAQVSTQDVSALVGFAGTVDVEGFSVEAIVEEGIARGNLDGLSDDQRAAFLAEFEDAPGFALNDVTDEFSFESLGDGVLNLRVDGTIGSFNAGGVLVDVEGVVSSSTIAVEGNAVQGSAIGNSASNSVTVASTSADGNMGIANSEGWVNAAGDPESEAVADTSLASIQLLLVGSSSTTEVFTTFAIDGALDTAITDSSLSVSGNSAYGEAIGNTVTNSLTVAGTDLAGTATSGGLTSVQDGATADISASSTMDVASNVVSSGSNIAMDRNANSALGVVNNSTNTLTASSTNSTSVAQATGNSDVADGDNAEGDASFVLINAQNATGTLDTSATTSVYNIGSNDEATTGLVNGSVSMSNNATRSESTANRSANTVSVGADANLGASALLLNQQSSSTATVATATSNVAFAVAGTTTATESLDTSSVSVEGNTTLALARGNSASNTLNYTAGANYTGAAANATTTSLDNSVLANAALFNDQSNTGAVSATAAGGTSIALNATSAATDAGVLNASVSNSNNSTTAFAVGNTAANTVMLSALNTGMANVALGNQQTNTGAVTATASTVTYSISSLGTFGTSSFVNSGNAASATAIGNSSVSVIGAR